MVVHRSTLPDIAVQHTNVAGITITNKSCLIMDEVDGMSAGDRGGVGALVALIKKTKVSFLDSLREVLETETPAQIASVLSRNNLFCMCAQRRAMYLDEYKT